MVSPLMTSNCLPRFSCVHFPDRHEIFRHTRGGWRVSIFEFIDLGFPFPAFAEMPESDFLLSPFYFLLT